MIRRCYDIKSDNYNSYGNLGIKVCNEWLIRDNFINDMQYIPQYCKWYRFPTLYQLDKDYLQQDIPKNKRIYSKDTCIFLNINDNNNLRIIESNNSSNYYGVTTETQKTYSCSISINGKNLYIGTFNNEIAAANAFNYWQKYFHRYDIIPLLNTVPIIMQPNEFIKYNTRPKNMCNIIRKGNL